MNFNKSSLAIIFLMLTVVTAMSQKPEVVVQLGHTDKATAVVFSNNGQFLVSGGGDNAIKIWDMKTGLLVRTLSGHKWPIKSVSCSPDGKFILSASEDDYARLWELQTGKLIRILPKHKSDVEAALFSPNGKLLATASEKEIKLWDLNGNLLKALNGHTEEIGGLAFSPDGTRLVSGEDGYSSNSIKIWDVASGKALNSFPVAGGIQQLQFSPSGNEVLGATGGGFRDGRVILHTQSGAARLNLTDSSGVWAVCFSRDGKKIFWGGSDGLLKVADVASGKTIKTILLRENGSLSDLNVSPDGRYLACATGWKVLVIDLESYRVVREMTTRSDYVWSLGLSNNGQYMATASGHIYGGQSIKLWDVQQGKLIKSFKGHKSWILSLAIGSDGRYIGSGSDDATMAYWEMPGVKSTNTFRSVSGSVNIGNKKVNAVAFHPEGRYLAGATADGLILYVRAGRSNVQKMESPSKGLSSICFSPDGRTIVAGTNNGQLELWDVESKTLTKSIQSHIYNYNVLDSAEAIPYGSVMNIGIGNSVSNAIAVASVTFSPDGKWIASAGGPDIKIWNAATLELSQILKKNAGLTSVTFSHDNSLIAAGGADHNVMLWEVVTGKLLQVFTGHQHEVRSIAFSPEDKFLYSGSLDTQIKVWDLKAKREVLSYIGISNSDDFIAITPEGYYQTTKGASKVLAFRVGNKMYPFDQFDLKFHRPDIVLKEISRIAYNDSENSPNSKLIQSYASAYQKRLKKLGFVEAQLSKEMQIPEVKVLSSIPTSTTTRDISLEIEATDSKYFLDRINISVNDVPFFGVAGIPLKGKSVSRWRQTINLPLSRGANEITVSVLNEKGIESLNETHVVEYLPASVERPNFYLIALGASKYLDSNMNLNFAAKDARDLVKLFSSNSGDYQSISIDTLLDYQLSIANVLSLREKLLKTKVDDRVILFIAGHGLLDKNLDYYLATHDVNFSEPSSKGLPYEKLEHLLDGIPARNKVLFMDACHSGEIDKEEVMLSSATVNQTKQVKFRAIPGMAVQKVGLENSFELMKELFTDLRKGNGTTVISSAGGAEYAMEGEEWSNGIFTYCLLSGLKEKKADLNGDGVVMLSELHRYLTTTVFELTEGKQKPTSRVENISGDFEVWH